MFKKRRHLDKEKAFDLGHAFLKKCKFVVISWSLIILTSVILIILLEIYREQGAGTWISAIFTTCCVADIWCTSNIIPFSFKVKKDVTYKGKDIKSAIRWIRATILCNLIFAIGFAIWIWTTNSVSETVAIIAKWFVATLLIVGSIFFKVMFISKWLDIRKIIPNLFADPIILKPEYVVRKEKEMTSRSIENQPTTTLLETKE